MRRTKPRVDSAGANPSRINHIYHHIFFPSVYMHLFFGTREKKENGRNIKVARFIEENAANKFSGLYHRKASSAYLAAQMNVQYHSPGKKLHFSKQRQEKGSGVPRCFFHRYPGVFEASPVVLHGPRGREREREKERVGVWNVHKFGR